MTELDRAVSKVLAEGRGYSRPPFRASVVRPAMAHREGCPCAKGELPAPPRLDFAIAA